MSFDYDPDLPAGFQDADFEMRDLQAAAARDARLRKAGRCTHSWYQDPPGPPSAPTSVYTCHHCGATFPTEAALMASAAVAKGDV